MNPRMPVDSLMFTPMNGLPMIFPSRRSATRQAKSYRRKTPMSAGVDDRADAVAAVEDGVRNRQSRAVPMMNQHGVEIAVRNRMIADGGGATMTSKLRNHWMITPRKVALVKTMMKNWLLPANLAGQRFSGRFRLGKMRSALSWTQTCRTARSANRRVQDRAKMAAATVEVAADVADHAVEEGRSNTINLSPILRIRLPN